MAGGVWYTSGRQDKQSVLWNVEFMCHSLALCEAPHTEASSCWQDDEQEEDVNLTVGGLGFVGGSPTDEINSIVFVPTSGIEWIPPTLGNNGPISKKPLNTHSHVAA